MSFYTKYHKKYYEENKEKCKAYYRKIYSEHKEEIARKGKEKRALIKAKLQELEDLKAKLKERGIEL